MLRSGPRGAAYAVALAFAFALAADLLWMPVQVADSIGEILDAQRSPSAWESFTGYFGTEAYLRPLRIAQIKALFDLSQGRYYQVVFRGFHALLVVAALLLFIRTLRVRTMTDFGAAASALVVFIGVYSFRGMVRESFPINHFLEMAVACLVALNLAQSRGGKWVDVAAAVTLAAAALTLESGLLVWVVIVAAWMVGWRGVSVRGLAAITVILSAYLYLRFVRLSTGLPALSERSAGYLFAMLDPPELQARFGANPLWFYAYNVAASVSSVLFSEPQDGVFVGTANWLEGTRLLRFGIPIVSSVLMTGLIVWAAARRLIRQELDDSARLLFVFFAILAGNAVLSYAYAQDEIMSIAGCFYALAAFVAIRDTIERVPATSRLVGLACAVCVCALAATWSIRAAGVHYVLRSQANKHQADWVALPDAWRRQGTWPTDPARQEVLRRLHGDAVRLELPNTRIGQPEWPDRLWPE
jgi:hypothetical protein